jgi:hypothetical protein
LIESFSFLFLFFNFGATHRAKGCELVAVDLERDIAEQGPFDMLLYKVRIPLLLVFVKTTRVYYMPSSSPSVTWRGGLTSPSSFLRR